MQSEAVEGARNLLLNCAKVCPGDRLLILHEDAALGWYDVDAPMLVERVARELGVEVTLREVGGPNNDYLGEGGSGEGTLIDADCDCCIFFARIGDQLRFDPAVAGRTRVMCYVTSLESFASDYGRVEYQAMASLKATIDGLLVGASDITISCPLGTDLRGTMQDHPAEAPEDVTVLRFPLGVHAPINACTFSGEVQLARYLTPTGSRVYEPPCIEINQPVKAEVADGRIVQYVGNSTDIDRIERHYEGVARQFSLDPNAVLSWHAGIHPGCRFNGQASDDPDRWSNTVFTNPRFVHFHTCGSSAPGEICWMVLDPTICVDGAPLWERGVLRLDQFPATDACLQRWPQLRKLQALGNGEVGL